MEEQWTGLLGFDILMQAFGMQAKIQHSGTKSAKRKKRKKEKGKRSKKRKGKKYRKKKRKQGKSYLTFSLYVGLTVVNISSSETKNRWNRPTRMRP